MRSRWRRLLILIMLGGLLAGCWDRGQLEDQYYVIKLGLDSGENGQVLVSAQVALTTYLSTGLLRGSAQAGESTVACHTMTTAANSITQAIRILNGSLTRSLTLKHLRAVIIGEDLGREGIEPVLMELWRLPEIRGTSLAAQVRGGTARDLLVKCRPLGEVNVARVPEGLLLQQKRFHLAPPMRLHQFMTRLAAPGGDPFMPAVGINPGVDGNPEDLTDGRQSALAGEMSRLGGNAMEFLGTAIYRRDQLAGFLTVDETQMLLALRGEMGKAYMSIPDPTVPERYVTLRFQQENLPRYQALFRGEKPSVSVRLLLEGEVVAIPSGIDYVPPRAREQLEEAAARFAEETIRSLLDKLRDWEADPVGFGHLFRGRFADWDRWITFTWAEQVAELEVDAKVEMRIRRFGLYTGPDRTRGGS